MDVKKPKHRYKKKKRECLMCERQFVSLDIWNRICDNCKDRQKNISPKAEGVGVGIGLKRD
jgi:Zn finger protein HypA/HybF involved in hydrogenase expression